MSFIPRKKRKKGRGYKSFLTSKKVGDSEELGKQKRSYKSYLTGSSEQVPRSTTRRWEGTKETQQQEAEVAGPSQAPQSEVFQLTDDEISDSSDDHDSDKASERTASSEDSSDNSCESVIQLSDQGLPPGSGTTDDSETSTFSLAAGGPEDETDDNFPLYEGSDINVNTAIGSILDFYISNSLSKQALDDLLKLINSLLPSPNLLPKSKYKLDQFIMKNSPSANYYKHFYCSSCHFYIGVNCEDIPQCPLCKSEDEKGFFLTYDLKSLLKNFLENGNAYKHIVQPPSATTEQFITDITDGVCYKELKQKFKLGPKDLTLIWNTDGVPVFKSSKSQLWPLQFTIAEIPPEMRNKYVLVCGIWYGPEKPDMNTFLKPFSEDLFSLQNEGVEWCVPDTQEIVSSKVFAPVSCLDAVARASVMNIHQFNGEFGCNTCEDKGTVIPCGQGTSRIYRVEEESSLRTNETIIQSAQDAVNSESVVKGIKGPSILSTVFYFNLAHAFVPDYMHCVLLGVVRQFLFLWMNPSNKDKAWCLSGKKVEMDKRLAEIKPPSEISRMPRSVELRKYWKASEYRAWLLFYSAPTLVNILPQKYFDHWLLLVFSVFTLLQDNISKLEINLCTVVLRMFCNNIDDLYGQEQLTFNVHQLIHLPLSVERWGPLWATSAFTFENNNGLLLKLIHGTQQVAMQMANTFKYINGLCVLQSKIERITCGINKVKPQACLGKPLKSKPQLSLLERREISNHFDCDLNVKFFAKCFLGKTLFTSLLYIKSSKRNNYTVMYKPMDAHQISYVGYIKCFLKQEDQTEVFCLIKRHEIKTNVFQNRELSVKIKHLLQINSDTSSVDVVPLSNVSKKLVSLNKELVSYLPNEYESNL